MSVRAAKGKQAGKTSLVSNEVSNGGAGVVAPVNELRLVGRLGAPAEVKELPSGDELVTWRLVVDRPRGTRRLPEGARPATVDTLDCVGWSAAIKRSSQSWTAGDVLEVQGALRRRFYRAGAGVASRYEVEATVVRRVARAG